MEIMDPIEGPRMLLARMPIQDCTSIFSEEIPRATEKTGMLAAVDLLLMFHSLC